MWDVAPVSASQKKSASSCSGEDGEEDDEGEDEGEE